MSNYNEVGQRGQASFGYFKLCNIRGTALNTAGNAVITLPILSGGLGNSGNTASSGAVILRRVTIMNPSGTVASANVSIGTTNDGANLVIANTVLTSVNAAGTYQDIAINSTYQNLAVSGNVTSALYVNVNTASGNANTVEIAVYGDVVNY